jgi:hypothetical protein
MKGFYPSVIVVILLFLQVLLWSGFDRSGDACAQVQEKDGKLTMMAAELVENSRLLSLDEPMWKGHPGRNISSCVIVRTWAGHAHSLGAMLATTAAAAHRDISIHIIDTGSKEAFTSLPGLVSAFNSLVGFEMAHVSNRTTPNSRPLFPSIGDMEDYGYIATDLLIDDMLKWNAMATASRRRKPCETLYITNGDNIVAKTFFLHMLDAVAKGHNLVASNFVHKGSDFQMRGHTLTSEGVMLSTLACGGWRPGRDKEMFAQLRTRCIDLAAVVTNASMWENGARFVTGLLQDSAFASRGRKGQKQIIMADGNTFGGLSRREGANPLIIRRALMFHQ